jgi:hypothetical protein
MFIWALADISPGALILEVVAQLAAHLDSPVWQRDPLWWCAPNDAHLRWTSPSARAGQHRG